MPLISAYGYIDLRQGSEQLLQWTTDVLSPIFQVILGDYSSSEFFFAKCLLFILLLVIITFVLNKAKIFGSLDEHPGVIYIIAIAVSILAIRFLPDNSLINGILLPYSTLGIALTTFLPLLIYFFFINNANIGHFGRRAGWVLYGIIFLALWLSQNPNTSKTTDWIYWCSLGFVIASFFFDSAIHRYFNLNEYHRFKRRTNVSHINDLKLRIAELKAQPDWQTDKTLKKEIEDKEKALKKAQSSSD